MTSCPQIGGRGQEGGFGFSSCQEEANANAFIAFKFGIWVPSFLLLCPHLETMNFYRKSMIEGRSKGLHGIWDLNRKKLEKKISSVRICKVL
jgi:hypothetical protein